MATAQEARRLLSSDVGDDLEGRLFVLLTANGTTTTAESDEFLDFDDEQLDTEKMTLLAADGTNVGEERKVSLSGNVATATRAFTNTTTSGDEYEVHRLFTASEKDNAIVKALELVWPRLFVKAQYEFTTVANQLTYDLSAGGFYKDIPRQVRLVSEQDTEKDNLIYDWDIVPDTGLLRLGEEYSAGRTIRTYGHQKPSLSNVSTEELGIVTARAGMYLYDQAIQSQRNDFVGRYEDAKTIITTLYEQRLADKKPTAIPLTRRFSGWKRKERDVLWDRA